ncbi:hypothetical protein DVH24_005932 [Malus domestica]|uniref:Uncharacterized protein n=1 Tax=Malus domestica TaxID=3750 RepID=A0A498IKG3_MALDO|nr:hypothetical protein DVH24_005932 [Malus domestica]
MIHLVFFPFLQIYCWIYVVLRPIRFCASTFGAIYGNRHEKLCRVKPHHNIHRGSAKPKKPNIFSLSVL